MQQYYDNEKQPQSQEQMNMLLVSEEYKGSIRTRLKKIGLALPKNHNLILSPPKFHFRLVKINNHLLTLNGLTQIYQF